MSKLLIQQYLNDLARLREVSGTGRETVVREAFKDLLKGWGKSHDLFFVPEHKINTKTKERRFVDGALLHTLRVPFGYWEAKDSKDDLDKEIEKKFKAGYPKSNIIFEDSTQAVLFQFGEEVMRCSIEDVDNLDKLITLFFEYERPEIEAFKKAVEQFKTDLPAVLDALRDMIEKAYDKGHQFQKASAKFLENIREAINPSLGENDVREMLIQHILTGELFAAVFPGTTYHEDNSVACEMHKLETTFFTGNTRHQTLKALSPYYTAIRRAGAEIGTHHEKQTFLKAIYENFYKVYNPKAADRLGVVYTPNEIVRFMIESADWLCEKHFKRNLIDAKVDILDPATGTGTFICEILEHFRGQKKKLIYKYESELHANEVCILPYYVANLNIEATYAAITGSYTEYPGLCLVDTLDNTFALKTHKGQQMGDLFGSLSDDNVKRIQKQNEKKISVIIGNPPYNANQLNENENNKNRAYPEIDKRIKDTYIKASTAQKTKLYDPYARFFRWASDRLENDGILAFITNRSFIDRTTFDGFRKKVAEEFSEIHLIDLGGDVRVNPKLSGAKHNVFGIQTGVAISLMVKREKKTGCRIFYTRRPEMETAEEKLVFLGSTKLQMLNSQEIKPDKNNNWINLVENDFDSLIPIVNKKTKATKNKAQEQAIFKLFSNGVVTARDEWMVDFHKPTLSRKANHFCNIFEAEKRRWFSSPLSQKKYKSKNKKEETIRNFVSREIKWTEELEKHLNKKTDLSFQKIFLRPCAYRPFINNHIYYARALIHRTYQQTSIFPIAGEWDNLEIGFSGISSSKPFSVLITNKIPSFDFLEKTQFFPRWRYDENGNSLDNITDWGLEHFHITYKTRIISKEDIFHYVYGVLHDPVYRKKYALNLKREFPRIPFYPDFWQWAKWGKELMDLHIEFETLEPYPLKRIDVPDERASRADLSPKVLLKADKDNGIIHVDSETTLNGIPKEAWEYRLGNRSALEWILYQHKEKKPKDPTIREKFNTYRFADYKAEVIDLLTRVTTVSLRTVEITRIMEKAPHS